MLDHFIAAGGIFLVFSFIHYAGKNKKPFKRALVSVIAGVGALTIINLLSGFSGLYIPVTKLSLLISAAGGIPGVAFLVLMSGL